MSVSCRYHHSAHHVHHHHRCVVFNASGNCFCGCVVPSESYIKLPQIYTFGAGYVYLSAQVFPLCASF